MTSTTCGACTMIVTELEIKIAEMEEKIRGKGDDRSSKRKDQETSNKGSLLRSEIQLSEALETICVKTAEWTTVVHPRTGKGVYARRPTLKLKEVHNHPTIHQFEDACSDFLDSYEDELLTFARKKHEEPVRHFCYEKIKVCTAVDVMPMTDEESGKAQILSDEDKEKKVEEALEKMKSNHRVMGNEL
uniref:DUF3456 domain-containing protein n=1 Tax=Setaria digitata TaxID=48799 RepID=A0A915PLS0_9BILA